MIVLQLDLQLPVQSVPITTKVVSLSPVQGEVYSIQQYVIKIVSDLVLNTINQTKPNIYMFSILDYHSIELLCFLK
jgi:hypothetical protein